MPNPNIGSDVRYKVGTSQEYLNSTKVPNCVYYLTDTQTIVIPSLSSNENWNFSESNGTMKYIGHYNILPSTPGNNQFKSSIYACTVGNNNELYICDVSVQQPQWIKASQVINDISDLGNIIVTEINQSSTNDTIPTTKAVHDYIESKTSGTGEGSIVTLDSNGKIPISKIPVDDSLSSTSINPVQNKVINTALEDKVNVDGSKGLSTNDFNDKCKAKLNNISLNAEETQSDWTETDSMKPSYIQNKPAILTEVPQPSSASATDSNLISAKAISNKFDSLNIPTVDDALSNVSTDPVQNKVIKSALDNKVDKEIGKGLSSNDFTDALKDKLEGLSSTSYTDEDDLKLKRLERQVNSDWNSGVNEYEYQGSKTFRLSDTPSMTLYDQYILSDDIEDSLINLTHTPNNMNEVDILIDEVYATEGVDWEWVTPTTMPPTVRILRELSPGVQVHIQYEYFSGDNLVLKYNEGASSVNITKAEVLRFLSTGASSYNIKSLMIEQSLVTGDVMNISSTGSSTYTVEYSGSLSFDSVYVNNILQTENTDYTYDSTNRTVTFLSGHIPTSGDNISVYYGTFVYCFIPIVRVDNNLCTRGSDYNFDTDKEVINFLTIPPTGNSIEIIICNINYLYCYLFNKESNTVSLYSRDAGIFSSSNSYTKTDYYHGDGVTKIFKMSSIFKGSRPRDIEVYINDSQQTINTDYTIDSPYCIDTFSGENMYVCKLPETPTNEDTFLQDDEAVRYKPQGSSIILNLEYGVDYSYNYVNNSIYFNLGSPIFGGECSGEIYVKYMYYQIEFDTAPSINDEIKIVYETYIGSGKVFVQYQTRTSIDNRPLNLEPINVVDRSSTNPVQSNTLYNAVYLNPQSLTQLFSKSLDNSDFDIKDDTNGIYHISISLEEVVPMYSHGYSLSIGLDIVEGSDVYLLCGGTVSLDYYQNFTDDGYLGSGLLYQYGSSVTSNYGVFTIRASLINNNQLDIIIYKILPQTTRALSNNITIEFYGKGSEI